MNNDIYKNLKDIKFEDLAFILLIVSGILDILGNDDLKNYYTNSYGKEDARKKFILSSCIILIAFGYFVYRNYKKMKELDPFSEEYKYAYSRFIGSLFLLVGELLILYYFINTSQLRDDGY